MKNPIEMPESPDPQNEIRDLLTQWSDGIRRKDANQVCGLIDESGVEYSLAPPLETQGFLHENLSAWFDTFDGDIGYEIQKLEITAAPQLGFCHSLHHLTGTKVDGVKVDLWFRSTMGFKKQDGTWKITHSHESVPFYMDGSNLAALDLKP